MAAAVAAAVGELGVLGLLLSVVSPALLLRRRRSTSDGRALKVGRGCKPSIQDE